MPLLLLSKSNPLRWASIWSLCEDGMKSVMSTRFFCLDTGFAGFEPAFFYAILRLLRHQSFLWHTA